MAEKGYEFAEVTSSVEPLPAGPKLVKVVFDVKEGPKVKVRTIDFVGNSAIERRHAGRQMKETKAHGMLSWITGNGTYKEAKFEEDAEKVVEYYRNKGYIARARRPARRSRPSRTATTRKRAGSSCDIPVDEGPRYRVGEFDFDGNKIVKTEFLQPLFKLKTGDWYTDKPIRNGLRQGARGLRRPAATSSSPASRTSKPRRSGRGPDRRPGRADRRRDDADARKASSTSSTASRSPATPRRATT